MAGGQGNHKTDMSCIESPHHTTKMIFPDTLYVTILTIEGEKIGSKAEGRGCMRKATLSTEAANAFVLC